MKLSLYQVDAFTDQLFKGNPACVVPLSEWMPDEMLLNIAKENAVAETAFFIDDGETVQLRWFTPEIEMDLCGHATLAAAHVLKTMLLYPKNTIVFNTASGTLNVTVDKNLYTLDFPSRKPMPAALPTIIKSALNIQPGEILKSRDFVLVYETEAEIRNIKIDKQIFDKINLDPGGVIVTAKGDDCDFVSRFFTPQSSILEDPVTGSAHCSLIPYWSGKLNKKNMTAKQLSERTGKLICVDNDERVLITGEAKTYSVGSLFTD
jgi:PhzF family phenazine biosynthesis protein